MKVICKIWVSAKTEDKAIKLVKKLEEKFEKSLSEITIEPYSKTGGFLISSLMNLENVSWNDSVVETITLAQRIGHQWQIGGAIGEGFLIGSNKTNISGIESIDLTLLKDRVNLGFQVES